MCGVASNRLSGTIPSSIYNISSLLTFEISVNQIQGSMPSSLFRTLSNLQYFNIATNQFTGPLPLSISNATNLVWFQVTDNKLTGKVPNLQKLHNLSRISFEKNHLGSGNEGDLRFLSDLTNATQLEWLLVSDNNFGGTLAASMSNLSTNLEFLFVDRNQLHGSIPAGIGNLVNINSLLLSNNMFTGTIPTDIGKLSSLGRLWFNNNRLSGSIPSFLGNLTSLLELYLQENNFNGTIPTRLGECKSLLLLDLSRNNLSGHIPPEVFSIPALSNHIFMDSLNLHKFVKMALGESVAEIADSSLLQVGNPSQSTNDALEECLSSILGIGVGCSVEYPTDRMNIGDVVSALNKIRAALGIES